MTRAQDRTEKREPCGAGVRRRGEVAEHAGLRGAVPMVWIANEMAQREAQLEAEPVIVDTDEAWAGFEDLELVPGLREQSGSKKGGVR